MARRFTADNGAPIVTRWFHLSDSCRAATAAITMGDSVACRYRGKRSIKAAARRFSLTRAALILQSTSRAYDHENHCANPFCDELHVVYILMRDNDRHLVSSGVRRRWFIKRSNYIRPSFALLPEIAKIRASTQSEAWTVALPPEVSRPFSPRLLKVARYESAHYSCSLVPRKNPAGNIFQWYEGNDILYIVDDDCSNK